MDEVVGEARPGIDLDQQVAQFHPRQSGGDQVFKGFGAVGASVGLQGRENEDAVFDPDRAVFARQEFLHPGHARFEFGVAFFETLASVVGCAGLADHFRAVGGPLCGLDEVGIRVGIASALFDPDIAGAQGAAQMPERAEFVVTAAETAFGCAEIRPPRLAGERDGRIIGNRSSCG